MPHFSRIVLIYLMDILLEGFTVSKFSMRFTAEGLMKSGILKVQERIFLNITLTFASQKGRYPAIMVKRITPQLHRSAAKGL